ncbi:unnamed protein product [Spodoptera exigua]|nr:unnamed protein product [Spodoptera exigua]
MFNKKLYFALLTLLVVSNVVCGKKSRKNKRPKDQEDYTTIQPNVVAYSTFGVNDVVSYDGFIPTSPDYATFLSGVNQESTTRLYAPAFPSSMDTTGFGGNYGAQAFEGQSFGVNEVNMGQPGGMLQYSSNSMNFFNNPNFGTTAEQNNNNDSEGASGHNHNAEETDSPVYGTKINSRQKYRTNNTSFNSYSNGYSNLSDNKYLHFPEPEQTNENKPAFSESGGSYQNTNNFVHNYEPQENEDSVERWRQSYLKTKLKDAPVRDYESYGSETKPMHVPIPKPYPIEVPHPVIVPVPRPFPVRVPVSRPVAVPVVREITVPIEKPVPYPVYKKVPYPVEKLVPVPVEKEVAVPVEKPYPVHVPYVRPVFHHTKPVHEDPENIEEEDFMRRPELKKPTQYKKRPYGTRYRSRRPSRASYQQDRNRRRWPERRRPTHSMEHRHQSRPTEFHSPPYKHRDYEPEEDDEPSDYRAYCRRTGNC